MFKYAVLVHMTYFFLSLILVLFFFRDQNDFLVFYKVGGIFVEDITDLYNQENYLWDFRYFPLSAVFFVPFYLLGFDLGFIVFHIINLILNILICILLYKIILLVRWDDHEKNDKRVVLYICLYLMGLPQMFNYVLGQINLWITFLVLLSLYLFLIKEGLIWNLIASIILGVSIVIKPTSIFLVPFLIMVNYDLKTKSLNIDLLKTLIRLFGSILPLLLNFILFFLYPELWEGFLSANLTGSTITDVNFSFSITRNIINFLYFYGLLRHHLILFLAIVFIIVGLSLLIFIFGHFENEPMIFGYTLGILIMFLTYFDSWDHHLVNLTPLLIILIFALPRNSDTTNKFIKPGFFFLCFLDLAFMGLWFLTQSFFPYHLTTTIFLILILIGIAKHLLKPPLTKEG